MLATVCRIVMHRHRATASVVLSCLVTAQINSMRPAETPAPLTFDAAMSVGATVLIVAQQRQCSTW